MIASVEDDPWGLTYKVVRKKLNSAGAGSPQDPATLTSCRNFFQANTRYGNPLWVLLRSRKYVECMRVEVKGVEIASAETLIYLGVLIDRRLSFKAHAMYARKKAAMTAAALARIQSAQRGRTQIAG